MWWSAELGSGDTVPESDFIERFKQVADEHRQQVYEDAARRYEELREKGISSERLWMELREEMIMAVEEAVTAMLAFGGPLAYASEMAGMPEPQKEGEVVMEQAEKLESFIVGSYIAHELLGEPSTQETDEMGRWLAEMEEEISGSWKEVA